VYSDVDILRWRRDVLFPPENESDTNLTETARRSLLDFLSASPDLYSVVFVASATQALKLVGESYPWTSDSKFIYTRVNHNSVLGIRKYAIANDATFHVIDSSHEIIEDDTALYALPLEDNFAGTIIPLSEMRRITDSPRITVLADAAAYLPTNRLNLTDTPFHACALSFYKIFGFPNFGALVIRKDFERRLVKRTFTDLTSSDRRLLEDQPIPIESIKAVIIGFESIKAIGIDRISRYVWRLTRRLYLGIAALKHSTDQIAAEIYGNHELNDSGLQGGVVAFNLKNLRGLYIGYAEVVKRASQAQFHLRGGCHCNPGACFESMKLSEDVVQVYFDNKTTCGDNNDIVHGVPLGSVRASIGWATTEEDIDNFHKWLIDVFIL
jgi:molybdenum cofactor sulfurtransferase